jgi:hypothetical protein
MTKQYIAIDARTALAVAPCMSTEETRYYLCGIYVAPNPLHGGGVVAVATDGHTLAARRCADGRADRGAILKLSKATISALKKRDICQRWLVAELGESGAPHAKLYVVSVPDNALNAAGAITSLQDDVLIAYVEPGNSAIDGTFPDWQRVVPHELPLRDKGAGAADVAGFNAAYLGRFTQIPEGGCRASRRFPGPIAIYSKDPSSPAVVLNGDREFLGVIMPHRHVNDSLPDWFAGTGECAPKPAPAPAEAEAA